jgi:monothiol glutaredoxin
MRMALSEETRTQLNDLIKKNKVVLFMKGNRHFPQCGFSAQVVGILDKLVKGYETVNVLKDPTIREGIKEFSNWPTIPQLYVDGEFVGGCDIIKEMYAAGELQTLLGAKEEPAKPPAITLSETAAKAFKDAAGEAGDDVLRLEIDAQFQNDLFFGPKKPGDFEVTSAGVTIHVDRATASRANGVAIDFVKGPNGQAGFKLTNPNEPPRVKSLSATEAKALLDAGKLELFDVRPEAERARAKIDIAKSLDAEGQKLLFSLPKDTAIALHCHHGMRSRNAAEQILREGFTNVYNLEGGIEAWSRDVDPSVPRY